MGDHDDDDLHGPVEGEDIGLAAAVSSLGCDRAFTDLLRPFYDHEPPVVAVASTSKTGGYLLLGAPDCQAAVYLGASRLFIALTPEEGHELASSTCAEVIDKGNMTTLHCRVLARDLVAGEQRNRLQAAITRALDLSRDRPARSRR